VSHNRKLESKKNVEIAEDLIKTHLSYTPELNDTSRKAFLKALNYLSKAIELDSLNTRAYHDKLTVLTDLGKDIDVMTLSKLLKIDPGFVSGYTQLGFVYERQGKIDSAKQAYENAKSAYLNKPNSDTRNLNLIIIEFLISNNKANALAKLKDFPIKNPELLRVVKDQINEIDSERLIKK
jgi:tetratricopeptide (TPR) repeat protein